MALYRKDFPEAEENEYYWVDLIGCDVVNKEGQSIGQVKGMIDNGVHDILNVKRADGKEVLIPFVEDYLAEVNVEAKKIVVGLGIRPGIKTGIMRFDIVTLFPECRFL